MNVSTAKKINYIPQVLMFSVFTLFAIVFLILSIFVLNQKIPENYVETQATISEINEIENKNAFTGEIDYEYKVYIDYIYGGNTYQHKEYNKYDSSMRVGKSVTIYVNPDLPEEYMSGTSDIIIFLIISGIFFIVGVAGIVINVKRIIDIKRRNN